eukprot:3061222-Amphidinium_carterae.1
MTALQPRVLAAKMRHSPCHLCQSVDGKKLAPNASWKTEFIVVSFYELDIAYIHILSAFWQQHLTG